MKAVRGIIFLAIIVVFLLAGGMTDVQAGFEGNYNTFYGTNAGNGATGDDDFDTFIGAYAGYSNTTGSDNTFLGYSAGFSNTTGYNNTFIGYTAGYRNTTGTHNTFLGMSAGSFNTTGYYNTFLGFYAGESNTTGFSNTFIGQGAGVSNAAGYYNTFLGYSTGESNTTGNYNTFIGNYAGRFNTTGNYNTFIGNYAGYYETGSNKLYIDNSITTTPLIYGEFNNNMLQINGKLNVVNSNSGLVELTDNTTNVTVKGARMVVSHYDNAEEPVYLFGAASTATDNFVALGGGNVIGNAATQIDLYTALNTTTPVGTPRLTIIGNGDVGIGTQLPNYKLDVAGTVNASGGYQQISDIKFKKDIKSIDSPLMKILNINGVSYSFKTDEYKDRGFQEGRHYGVIGQEVEKVLPEIVKEGQDGGKSVSYTEIIPVLIEAMKEQQKIIDELKTEVKQLKTGGYRAGL